MRKISIRMIWLTAGATTAIAVLACGTMESLTNSPSETKRGTEAGYNEGSEAVTCNALPSGHACPQYATLFTDACLDGGHEIQYCEECVRLCSGEVSVASRGSNPSGEPGSGTIDATECSYFGKKYAAGAAFPSADGCNSCTCESDSGVASFASCAEIGCPNIQPFDGSISEVRFDVGSDSLIATLTYQACKEMTFNLRVDENSCGKSNPWQCDGYIFYAEPADNCTSEVRHQVTFSLAELTKRPANLFFRGVSGSCTRVVVGDSDGGTPDLCL